MKIQNDNFAITIDAIQFETSYEQSFKAQIEVVVYHSSGKFSYLANDIWIDYNMIKDFPKQVEEFHENVTSVDIKLKDMSSSFILNFIKNNSDFEIGIIIKEHLIQTSGLCDLNFKSRIEPESLFVIKNILNEFIEEIQLHYLN